MTYNIPRKESDTEVAGSEGMGVWNLKRVKMVALKEQQMEALV